MNSPEPFPTPDPWPRNPGGGMAALVRAHDWSRTPLGPFESWPQSLRTVVDMALASPLPHLICWGAELTCIYNDAYIPLLGDKHNALGVPLLDMWPEAGNLIHSLVQKARAGESSYFEQMPFTLLRNGRAEQTWFTYAFSPLRDETGTVAGMLNSGIEMTSSVETTAAHERLYDALLSTVQDLICVFDLNHRFAYANQALLTVLGKTWEQAIGRTCLELGYPDWHAAMHDLEIDEVIATRLPVKGEVPFSGTLGRRIYEYIFVPIMRPDGTVEAVGGTTRDVTERKRREERDNFLVSLTDALRPMVDTTNIMETASRLLGEYLGVRRCGYGEVDASGEFLTVERDWTDGDMPSMAGTVRMQDFGERVLASFRGGQTVRLEDPFSDSRAIGARAGYPAAGDVRGGIGVPLVKHNRLAAILYVHQTRPRAWSDDEVALVEDVAERTWEAVERSRVEKALRRSEELQRLAMDAGRIGTWDLNVQTMMSSISAQMAKLMGYGSREMHVPAADWLASVVPDDRDAMLAALTRSLRTGDPFEMEFRIVLDSGEERWVYSRAAIVRDASGQLHAYGASTDITEPKRAETDLEQANRAKDEFLAMLGHELRNPLSPIVTALQLMRMRAPDSLVRERRIIETQVQHLVGMVDDLLDVSRIARGKVELKMAPIEMTRIVAKAIETAEPLLERHEQKVATAIDEGLAVNGDERRLVQVVTNLLTNAAKYSPPQRIIRIRAAAEDGEAVLRVRDQGIGIDGDLLPRVFDLFTQSVQSIERAEGGLGLGLALVRNLVELHGGNVEVHSEGVNRGSEFIVRLPLIPQRRAGSETGAHTMARPPAEPAAPAGAKVLIVDDYPDAANSLADLLQLDGYETRVVYDGAAAIESVAEFKPAVALIDIGLPAMDGYQVARRLRELEVGRQMALIAVTGYGRQSDRAHAREAGFDEHVVKPLDPETICKLIDSFTAPADPKG
ncbi:MAG TPA: PAS domain-containing protein [Gammaproteobacteria bacterium]|nr:PAS domain-containing protein [Gammaproteobacteria bacterium]